MAGCPRRENRAAVHLARIAPVTSLMHVLTAFWVYYGSLVLPFGFLLTPIFRRAGPWIVGGVALQMLASVAVFAWFWWLLGTGQRDALHFLFLVVFVNIGAGVYYLCVMCLALLFPASEELPRPEAHSMSGESTE